MRIEDRPERFPDSLHGILGWLYEGFSSHVPAFVKVLQN